MEAVDFIRHYDDATYIILALSSLPHTSLTIVGIIAQKKKTQTQIFQFPTTGALCFNLDKMLSCRSEELQTAYATIGYPSTEKRLTLETCCKEIRKFLTEILDLRKMPEIQSFILDHWDQFSKEMRWPYQEGFIHIMTRDFTQTNTLQYYQNTLLSIYNWFLPYEKTKLK